MRKDKPSGNRTRADTIMNISWQPLLPEAGLLKEHFKIFKSINTRTRACWRSVLRVQHVAYHAPTRSCHDMSWHAWKLYFLVFLGVLWGKFSFFSKMLLNELKIYKENLKSIYMHFLPKKILIEQISRNLSTVRGMSSIEGWGSVEIILHQNNSETW